MKTANRFTVKDSTVCRTRPGPADDGPPPAADRQREPMTTTDPTRRSIVQGAAAVGLGAIGLGALGLGTLAGCSTSTPAPAGATLAKADIPVGGGKVVGQVVVTQPTAGDFKAFTAVCPHEQCLVSKIEGGTIVCTCHGSVFDAATGAVKNGPATDPLAAKTVTVSGDNLVVS